MDKSTGARRRQLLTAVSVLGVSLGMAEAAHADASQTSHKAQHTIKGESQSSIKYGSQSSIKYGSQHSIKGESGSQ